MRRTEVPDMGIFARRRRAKQQAQIEADSNNIVETQSPDADPAPNGVAQTIEGSSSEDQSE
jgi:hypothetical protein